MFILSYPFQLEFLGARVTVCCPVIVVIVAMSVMTVVNPSNHIILVKLAWRRTIFRERILPAVS